MQRQGARVALVLALACGVGCRSNGERPEVPAAPQTAPPSREVQLAPGQTARVDGLTLKFDGVSADSRCPLDVQCFWEGDAVVVLTVSEPARAGTALELHTAGKFPREGTYGRYRIQLVSLVPQPREGEGVAPDQYRATLRVSPQ